MTLQEYLDPRRFPITARPNLTPQQQLMIDAFNIDKFNELEEEGQITTPRAKAILAELRAKENHIARLTRELAEAEG